MSVWWTGGMYTEFTVALCRLLFHLEVYQPVLNYWVLNSPTTASLFILHASEDSLWGLLFAGSSSRFGPTHVRSLVCSHKHVRNLNVLLNIRWEDVEITLTGINHKEKEETSVRNCCSNTILLLHLHFLVFFCAHHCIAEIDNNVTTYGWNLCWKLEHNICTLLYCS